MRSYSQAARALILQTIHNASAGINSHAIAITTGLSLSHTQAILRVLTRDRQRDRQVDRYKGSRGKVGGWCWFYTADPLSSAIRDDALPSPAWDPAWWGDVHEAMERERSNWRIGERFPREAKHLEIHAERLGRAR